MVVRYSGPALIIRYVWDAVQASNCPDLVLPYQCSRDQRFGEQT
jgi:hypothetical protein